MRTLLTLSVAFVVCGSRVLAQDKNWKKALEAQLEQEYPLTKAAKGAFDGPFAIKERGIVLKVQQPGIPANDGSGLLARFARVRNGEIVTKQTSAGPGFYILKAGDEVYVTDISVDDDKVVFRLRTVNAIEQTKDGRTQSQPFFAIVHYDFDRDSLRTADVPSLKKAISAILATGDQVAAVNQKTIELGQTIEQVEATFGKPLTVIKLGDKVIYTYKDIKVTFIKGKVADVQ